MHPLAKPGPGKDTSVFAQGDPVYWNPTGNPVGGVAGSGCATSTALNNYLLGFAAAAALTGDATVLAQWHVLKGTALAILVDAETHEVLPGGRGSRRIKDDGLFNARWIAATLRTPDGKRMFTINDSPEDRKLTAAGVPAKPLFDQGELDAIAAMPTRASERLISAALRLNSVSDAAVDAAAKN